MSKKERKEGEGKQLTSQQIRDLLGYIIHTLKDLEQRIIFLEMSSVQVRSLLKKKGVHWSDNKQERQKEFTNVGKEIKKMQKNREKQEE